MWKEGQPYQPGEAKGGYSLLSFLGGWPPEFSTTSPRFEIALVLVGLDRVASFSVDTDHSILTA